MKKRKGLSYVPTGVLREGELNMGCTEVMSPWGDAVAERTT